MKLKDLKPNEGSRRKAKRLGRGRSSGYGNTCCRGDDGLGQRSGASSRPGHEGGQTPMYRRLPKFQTNEIPNQLKFSIVNLNQLEKLSGQKEITPELLLENRIIDKLNDGLRVLGTGEMKFSATIFANHFSESAKQKIEKAGGKCVVIKKEKKVAS